MKQALKRLLPEKIQSGIKRALGGPPSIQEELRSSTAFFHIGPPGFLTSSLFEPAKRIPGWFNLDDCSHFYLVLSLQSAYGLRGDLFEIGSYHGRSTALMAHCLKARERLVVCDAFAAPTEDNYEYPPSPELLSQNILGLNPKLDPSRLVIHACLSSELSLPDSQRFRFIHIDGGHSEAETLSDLHFCERHLSSGGVIAVDDYGHRDWPGVIAGVDEFLRQRPHFEVLADLNRHGALGRKLYLIRTETD